MSRKWYILEMVARFSVLHFKEYRHCAEVWKDAKIKTKI